MLLLRVYAAIQRSYRSMDAITPRSLQAPLKQQYKDAPDSARISARAEVILQPQDICATLHDRPRHAGLHQATGGSGAYACSAETYMACKLTGGRVIAEGIWDARGTLGR